MCFWFWLRHTHTCYYFITVQWAEYVAWILCWHIIASWLLISGELWLCSVALQPLAINVNCSFYGCGVRRLCNHLRYQASLAFFTIKHHSLLSREILKCLNRRSRFIVFDGRNCLKGFESSFKLKLSYENFV